MWVRSEDRRGLRQPETQECQWPPSRGLGLCKGEALAVDNFQPPPSTLLDTFWAPHQCVHNSHSSYCHLHGWQTHCTGTTRIPSPGLHTHASHFCLQCFLVGESLLPHWYQSKEIRIRHGEWRRAWQLTPIFLPGDSHGQRSQAGYSPLGCKESDRTERLSMQAPRERETRHWVQPRWIQLRLESRLLCWGVQPLNIICYSYLDLWFLSSAFNNFGIPILYMFCKIHT